MTLSQAEQKFVFTTKIYLDEDDTDYVVLREPNTQEFSGFDISEDADAMKQLAYMEKLFPMCVVDSSIEKDDGTQASGKEIYDVLKKSSTLFTQILNEWMTNIPFQSRKKKKAN